METPDGGLFGFGKRNLRFVGRFVGCVWLFMVVTMVVIVFVLSLGKCLNDVIDRARGRRKIYLDLEFRPFKNRLSGHTFDQAVFHVFGKISR